MSYKDFKKLLNSGEQHITPHQVNDGIKVITAKNSVQSFKSPSF